MLGQWLSVSMQSIAQSFLVYYLTGSPAILGFTALATGLPQLTLLLFGGAFADRFQKKRLLQFSQAGEGISALIVLIALLTGYLTQDHQGTWWILIMTSIFSGIFNGLALPARQAMIAELVNKQRLTNAVSLTSIGQSSTLLVGPALAGLLIGFIDYEAVYGTMVILYLAAVLFTSRLPVIQNAATPGRNTLADIGEGLRYIQGNSVIFLIMVFNLACVLLSLPRNQLLPIFAMDVLHVGASGQGILQSIGAAGSLIASLIFASLSPKKKGIIMLLAGLNLGIATMIFAVSQSFVLSMVMTLFIGLGQTGHMVIGTVLLQTISDKAYLGRTMSVLMMGHASASLVTFVVGITAQFAGAQNTVAYLGIMLILISASFLLFFPRIRQLD
jgi:MFS transporter, DHA1 family, staphyloferrin A biosynthesis exporter